MALFILTGCGGGTEIFNGKNLEGWQCDPPELKAQWRVEDGMIVGENPDEKGSILWTTRSFSDFEVELEYFTPSDDYDSGLFLRNMSHQVQIGISRSLQRDMTACIYAPKDDRGSYPGQTDKVPRIHQPNEWNHLQVIVEDKRIRTFLNGEPMVDYTAVVLEDSGPLGLQLHSGVHMVMKFRNLLVRELGTE